MTSETPTCCPRDALQIGTSVELAGIADDVLLATIDAGNYGLQRISSQLMVMDDGKTALPSSFAFLGQRYIVDSHVFSKVVYPNTTQRRMMPNPLDVAFAALRKDQAAPLLRSELDAYSYAPSLAKARQPVPYPGKPLTTSYARPTRSGPWRLKRSRRPTYRGCRT